MKTLFLLLLVLVIGVAIGFWLNSSTGGAVETATTESISNSTTTGQTPPAEVGTSTAATSATATSGAVEVPASLLSEEQQQLLERFGIDPDNVVITPEMIVCAEEKIGQARLEEIKNGATPSFSESVSLVSCY